MITETPMEWDSPFTRWYNDLHREFNLISEINKPRVTKKINVIDDGTAYVLCHTPTGDQFIEETKVRNAESLGLSVGRA